MPLKRVKYTDSYGRLKEALLPDEEPNDNAEIVGILIGPPKLEELELPLEIEVRLNNELYHRGIFTTADAIKRRPEVMSALMAALKVDAGRIIDIYAGKGYINGNSSEPPEIKSNKVVPDRRRRRTR